MFEDIKDKELKNKYFRKIQEKREKKKTKAIQNNTEPFTMKKVIKRIRNQPLPSKVTLQDLHQEINIQKEEIRQLKEKLNEV